MDVIDEILEECREIKKNTSKKEDVNPEVEPDEPVPELFEPVNQGDNEYDTDNYTEFNKFSREKKNMYMKDARRFCKGALVEYYNWKGIDHRFKNHSTIVDIREVHELKRAKMYWAVRDKGFINDITCWSEYEYKNLIFNEMRNFISFMMLYNRSEFNRGGNMVPDMKWNELQHLVFDENDDKVLCIVITDKMITE